jgi:hypothetical protein
MNLSFAETIIEVWRQSLVESAAVVELDGSRYPVRRTPKRGLRQVDFVFEGNEIRWAGAEPRHEIGMDEAGAVGQKGDAVPQRRAVRGRRGRWECDSVR